jgi:hypothetical protein
MRSALLAAVAPWRVTEKRGSLLDIKIMMLSYWGFSAAGAARGLQPP